MNYSRIVIHSIFATSLFLAGCQNSDYSNTIKEEQASSANPGLPIYERAAEGSINGRAWQFVSGAATTLRRNNKTYLEIKLWNQVYSNPCSELIGSPVKVHLYTENKASIGKIDPNDPFSLIPTIMFSDMIDTATYRNNMIANHGIINVSKIANGKVEGSVSGSFNSENVGRTEVAGKFEVPLCEQKTPRNDAVWQ